jgi:phosphotriesterase-related protein
MAIVRTVLGDIDAETIGHTQTHEHLLCDLSLPLSADATTSERERDEAPIQPGNYFATRRDHTSEDLRLLSRPDAVDALVEYRKSGGGTIVEATSIGLGRDPEGLRAIALATGVHVVMGCGYYYRDYQPDTLDERSVDDIAGEMIRDIRVGVGPDRIRAGIIGEIGLGWPHHPMEETVLRAATLAQLETGAALLLHPGRHTDSPFRALEIVKATGGDPERVVMSHVDRTLFGHPAIQRLADTGCYVEFDLFGQESSYYSLAPIDMPNDATRVDYIVELFSRGYGNQVLIAQDVCHKTNLRKYGGEGYTHILDNVIPLMRRKGLDVGQLRALTHLNPKAALALPTN